MKRPPPIPELPAAPRRRRSLSEEERTLWESVAKQTKPLRKRTRAAKAQMGEAAVMVTSENIQVHGAVGFTWDSRAGVLYQRAKQNDVLGGSAGWHRQRIADLVLDGA